MTTQDICPGCFGTGTTLIKHADHMLPDLVRCALCTGSGLIACATCLDTGEVWSPDANGHYDFDSYCTCTEGRSQARKNCIVKQVPAITVPVYDQPFG